MGNQQGFKFQEETVFLDFLSFVRYSSIEALNQEGMRAHHGEAS
jgi:hypothetical protein